MQQKIMNLTNQYQLKAQEFAEFIKTYNSTSIQPEDRIYASELAGALRVPSIDEVAEEAAFSALAVKNIKSKKLIILYLSAWLYLREKVDVIFNYAAKLDEVHALKLASTRVNYLVGGSLKDKKFKRAFGKVLEALNGS